MRIKVSDGDLIIVGMPTIDVSTTQTPRKQMEEICDSIGEWTKTRGLSNVRIMAINGRSTHGITIDVLSVNDCFENQVLNAADGQKD